MTLANLSYTVLALLATVAAIGCDKKSDSPTSSAKPAEAPQPLTNEAATPVNAAIPAALKDKLSFTPATVADGDLAALVPAGWEDSRAIPGSYNPPNNAGLGFMTRFKVGSNCDGMCSPKEWTPIVKKVEFSQFETGDQFTIEKDEKLGDSGRLLIARSETSVYIVAAWWKKNASQYFYCRATLDDEAATALDAFEQACRSTRVLTW